MPRFQSILYLILICLFFAYYIYQWYIGVNQIFDSGVDRAEASLIPTHHFRRSSDFFSCKTLYEYCKGVLSNGRKLVRAQILTTLDRTVHEETMPIVPPVGQTKCEEQKNLLASAICAGELRKFIVILVCVAAGLLTVPVIFLVAWALAKWIQTVRPRKSEFTKGKQAQRKEIRLTGRDPLVRGVGHIRSWIFGREIPSDEENEAGSETWNRRSKLGEKEVMFAGVQITMPWGRGKNWDRAVAQLPSRGATRGMLVGMSPDSSSIYEIERGHSEDIRRAADVCGNAKNDGITRVVSTGRETGMEGMAISQRKHSGVVGLYSGS